LGRFDLFLSFCPKQRSIATEEICAESFQT
jgi:hypothetical protein